MAEELIVAVAEHGRDIENLKAWQKAQNGSLQKLEAKIDTMNTRITALLGGVITLLIGALVNLALGGR